MPDAALLAKSFPFGERLCFACEGLQVHVLLDNDKPKRLGTIYLLLRRGILSVEIGVQGHRRPKPWEVKMQEQNSEYVYTDANLEALALMLIARWGEHATDRALSGFGKSREVSRLVHVVENLLRQSAAA
jgi:hypothetical protein